MSYSQFDEEPHILEALKAEPFGRLLDIGAWDPLTFSNSRALIEAGWEAVLIEPSPGPMLNLLKEYGNDPKITLIQAAVGIEAGFSKMHMSDDAVSTGNNAEFERWTDHAKFHGSVVVPVLSMDQIAMQYGGFSFINIDAEGVSVDLFKRMLVIGWQPFVVCVEHESRLEELCSAATREHFHLVYSNGTNAVFVRR